MGLEALTEPPAAEQIKAEQRYRRVCRRWQLLKFPHFNPALRVYRGSNTAVAGLEEPDFKELIGKTGQDIAYVSTTVATESVKLARQSVKLAQQASSAVGDAAREVSRRASRRSRGDGPLAEQ